MNKLKLISKMSKKLNVKTEQVGEFLSCLSDVVAEGLKEEKKENPNSKVIKVVIGNLGAVHLKHRKEKVCKVPKSDKVVTLPARFVPVFKISKTFKDLASEDI
ncbi:HU family DNA-binding protein [Candidatus Phytoplasma sp. AldY-WA1]|jgi:DNA-binding protein HU-beta|uniref:HU family DNA-binding protein n=1 Tax=Candidatus Phytoplasma sp. AldY-WA1 TaxID=2852100 RepID=UPI001CE2D9DD|nr:HU family DNA-binding protein [Candidatus Phytoplasma sp. AldY-WA1]